LLNLYNKWKTPIKVAKEVYIKKEKSFILGGTNEEIHCKEKAKQPQLKFQFLWLSKRGHGLGFRVQELLNIKQFKEYAIKTTLNIFGKVGPALPSIGKSSISRIKWKWLCNFKPYWILSFFVVTEIDFYFFLFFHNWVFILREPVHTWASGTGHTSDKKKFICQEKHRTLLRT
jgi:hypothetical protein